MVGRAGLGIWKCGCLQGPCSVRRLLSRASSAVKRTSSSSFQSTQFSCASHIPHATWKTASAGRCPRTEKLPGCPEATTNWQFLNGLVTVHTQPPLFIPPLPPLFCSSGRSPAMGEGKYITLVSGDGFEFVVLKEAALRSKVIKSMLDSRSKLSSSSFSSSFTLAPHRHPHQTRV